MFGIAVFVAWAAVGVDYGWQPTNDGQLEYVIQIEPTLLESMRNGEEIASEIVPEARGVRRFRIRVGTRPVPRIGHVSAGAAGSLNTGNSGAMSSGQAGGRASQVLPPQADTSTMSAGGSAFSSTNSGGTFGEFRPDGFLNLPPPPSLLGADGKASVLIRPGDSPITSATDGSRVQEVLPPGGSTNTWTRENGGTLPATLSPTPPGTLPAGTWPPSVLAPPSGGVFPPSLGTGATFSTGASEAPPQRGGEILPPETAPPVPDRGLDSQSPQPIRGYGRSGVQPPTSSESATLGPHTPVSARADNDRATERVLDGDLLAHVSDGDAAAHKPTIDPETAEQLEPKPWTALVLTSLALFASLAANLYLGWVAAGIYRRYREVVAQLHQVQASRSLKLDHAPFPPPLG